MPYYTCSDGRALHSRTLRTDTHCPQPPWPQCGWKSPIAQARKDQLFAPYAATLAI